MDINDAKIKTDKTFIVYKRHVQFQYGSAAGKTLNKESVYMYPDYVCVLSAEWLPQPLKKFASGDEIPYGTIRPFLSESMQALCDNDNQ